jgi:hypothetical protein
MSETKKIFILTILLVCLSCLIAEQRPPVWVNAGLNIANMDGDISNNNSILGFNFGLYTQRRVSPTIVMQPGISITKKGFEIDYHEADGNHHNNINLKYNLIYIEAPILFNYALNPKSEYKPSLKLGPSIGFNFSAKGEAELSSWDTVNGQSTNYSSSSSDGDIEGLTDIDFCLVFGGSFQYKQFVFDARYSLGLNNLVEEDNAGELKSRTLTFLVGIKI